MRYFFILALLLSVASVQATSNSPSPVPFKSGENEKNQATDANKSTGYKQRSAKENRVLASMVPGEATKDKTTKEKNDKDYKMTLEQIVAYSTLAVAIVTGILAVGTIFLAIFTFNLWKAAAESTLISEKLFITSQRAWVYITAQSINLLKFPAEGGSVSLNATLVYKNVGTLPAVSVHVLPYAFLPDQTVDILDQAKRQQKIICERGRADPNLAKFGISQIIYPNGIASFSWATCIPATGRGVIRQNGGVTPIIVGCIYYRFSSSPTVHETGFIFDVHRRLPDGPLKDLIYGEEVPSEEIVVSDFWNGEASTDHQ